MQCYLCHKDLPTPNRIGRQEICPHCGGDLHICRNCDFYDAEAYNECRESQAERVVDKEKANFCDYFVMCRGAIHGVRPMDPAAEAKKKLEQLFKK